MSHTSSYTRANSGATTQVQPGITRRVTHVQTGTCLGADIVGRNSGGHKPIHIAIRTCRLVRQALQNACDKDSKCLGHARLLDSPCRLRSIKNDIVRNWFDRNRMRHRDSATYEPQGFGYEPQGFGEHLNMTMSSACHRNCVGRVRSHFGSRVVAFIACRTVVQLAQ